jgi:hypothetical protein
MSVIFAPGHSQKANMFLENKILEVLAWKMTTMLETSQNNEQ